DGKGRVRLEFIIPARGLIGFQTEFRTITAGTGLLFHVFDHYGPRAEGAIGQRPNGVLISNDTGTSTAYAQFALQERGRLMAEPGEEIYEGQIIGIHAKDNDLTVNALRAKQLTNFRAAGKDDALALSTPLRLSLEQALEFIDDDELVEVTPAAIRLRKKLRTETDRKRASRAGRATPARRSGGQRLRQAGLLADDQHGDFQRLLVVQARVDGGAVGALEVGIGQRAGAAGAFGDVLAGQLQVHAAQAGAGGGVQVEGLLQLGADAGEAPGLVAIAGRLGIAVHRVADPEHAPAFAPDRLQQRRQALADTGRAHAVDEAQPA